MGLIFDDRGNRMTPTHATKVGVRYRYYMARARPVTMPSPEMKEAAN
jgi:hypothetical protein